MGRSDSIEFFQIDCLRVIPQTHIFLKSADRDLSIARIGLGENSLYSKIYIKRRRHPCLGANIFVSYLHQIFHHQTGITTHLYRYFSAPEFLPRLDAGNREISISSFQKCISLWGESEAIDARNLIDLRLLLNSWGGYPPRSICVALRAITLNFETLSKKSGDKKSGDKKSGTKSRGQKVREFENST